MIRHVIDVLTRATADGALALLLAYILVVAVAGAVAFTVLTVRIVRGTPLNPNLLSTLVARERRRLDRRRAALRVPDWARDLYMPQWQTVALVVGILVLLHLTNRLFDLQHTFLKPPPGFHKSLVSFLSGANAFIVALTFFVTGGLLARDRRELTRVLLKVSNLWLLVPVSLLGQLDLLVFREVSYLSLCIPLIVVTLLIMALWRLINVLVLKSEFHKARLRLWEDLLDRAVRQTLDERIGLTVLLREITSRALNVEYSPISHAGFRQMHIIRANRDGFVSNVDLVALRDFGEELRLASKKPDAESITGSEVAVTPREGSGTPNPNRPKDQDEPGPGRLLVRPGQRVRADTPVAEMGLELTRDPSRKERLKHHVKRAIGFAAAEVDHLQRLQEEMRPAREELLDGLDRHDHEEVELRVRDYVSLAECLLSGLGAYCLQSDVKAASTELNDPWGGWAVVKWLQSQARDFLVRAVATEDKTAIGEVGFLSIQIAWLAVKRGDHYLFQSFIGNATLLYSESVKAKDADVCRFALGRSWRYLKETVDYILEPALEGRARPDATVDDLYYFAEHLLRVMDNLLDTAVRLQRIDDFSAFLREARHLLPKWADDLSEHRLNTIDMMLEHGSVGAPRREELEAERQRIHRQQDYDRRLRDRLEEMRFGIAAWLLKLAQEKPDDEPYKKMLYIVLSSLPQDMQGFMHTYVHCSRREVDNFWGWFRHQDMSEEHAVAFRPAADADHLFCARILQLLAEPDTAKQDGIELPLSSHLAAESSPEGGLTKLLNEIDANRKSWAAVLSDSAMEQVPRLRRMLADVIVRQEVETRRKLIDSSISDRRVSEFFAELVAEYEKDAQLKHILSEFLLYKDLRGTPPPRHVERRGINTIADKALFVENWPEGRIGFAEHYGQGLAVGETYDAWSVLETDPRTRRGELDGFLLELQSASGNGRPFVIVGGDAEYWLNKNAPSSFIPKWRNSQPSSHISELHGWIEVCGKRIPVYGAMAGEDAAIRLLLLDADRFGALVHYSALGDDLPMLKPAGVFAYQVLAFEQDTEAMALMLREPPEWLRSTGAPDAQKEHLRDKAWLRVWRRMSLELSNDYSGLLLETPKRLTKRTQNQQTDNK